jgi:hypothetical protein
MDADWALHLQKAYLVISTYPWTQTQPVMAMVCQASADNETRNLIG